MVNQSRVWLNVHYKTVAYPKDSSRNILSFILNNHNLRLFCLFLTDGYTSASGSFIFALRNNDNLAPFKAPLKYENDEDAIYRKMYYGPTFGTGRDLRIVHDTLNPPDSYATLGHTYQAPLGYTYNEDNTRSLLGGSSWFTPSEVEVLYYLNWERLIFVYIIFEVTAAISR